MTALSRAEEDHDDLMGAAMEAMGDSVCPAYCAECGHIGDLEHDFRGPCTDCECTDAGSLTSLLLGV